MFFFPSFYSSCLDSLEVVQFCIEFCDVYHAVFFFIFNSQSDTGSVLSTIALVKIKAFWKYIRDLTISKDRKFPCPRAVEFFLAEPRNFYFYVDSGC